MEEYFAKVMGGDGGDRETSGCQMGKGRLGQSSVSSCYVVWQGSMGNEYDLVFC